jgi:exodeoxyribonuclease VII small subunit|tara:strand:+ start:950 stop:1234 length:285 start_codon:yes stop_codon:yes gene_type:complete
MDDIMIKKIQTSEIDNLEFEEAMEKLNEIIQGLESGEVKLSQSVEKFELGAQLAKHCKKLLDDAETRINIIKISESGNIVSSSELSKADQSDND